MIVTMRDSHNGIPEKSRSSDSMNIYNDITIVVTSCERHDLLKKTLLSMRTWIDRFEHKIIVEDSKMDTDWFAKLRKEGWKILISGEKVGQHASIDMAYGLVDTKFIFHCEDDWLFCREPDFTSARYILENGIEGYKKISIVKFHDDTYKAIFNQDDFQECTISGSCFRYSLRQKNKYNSFSFNPNLQKLDIFKDYGPWKEFISEGSIARYLSKKGYIVVTAIPNICSHIGERRHVDDVRKQKSLRRVIKQFLCKGI